MGYDTCCDVIKAKAWVWCNGDSCCLRGELPPDILIPYYQTKFDMEYKNSEVVEFPYTLNGWTTDPFHGKSEKIGKRQRIYAQVWSKGDKKVFEVNEDEWESGGGVSISFSANTVEELKEFLTDIGLLDSCDVLEDETIQRTL